MKTSTKPAKKSSGSLKELLGNETIAFILGLFLILFAVYLLLAFISYFFTGTADQSILESGDSLLGRDNGIRNYAGSRGAQLAGYLINDCFGLAAAFIPVFLFVTGISLMKVRKIKLWKWFIVCALLLIWFSVFLGFLYNFTYVDSFFHWGGLHGSNVSDWLESQLGTIGVWLLLLATAICMLVYLSARTVILIRKILTLGFIRGKQKVPVQETLQQPVKEEENNPYDTIQSTGEPTPVAHIDVQGKTQETKDSQDTPISPTQKEVTDPFFEVETHKDELFEGQMEPYNPRLDLEFYRFPTIDLLKHYDDNTPTVDMAEQNANKDKIVETLLSFGIEISSIKATVGPTVTLYEITPQQGIRIAKIKSLEDDIALSLAALGIRIIAPIPGKGTIGIEVPNSKPKIVSGQSIIGSKKFQESTYNLPIALGKTITNEVFMVDLATMPHLLVAGASGQGKSVGLNTIITSLLYKKHPSELKFVLIDPKKLEFSMYSAIEYQYLAKLPDENQSPIITDDTQVIRTLNSLCKEMETRYDLLNAAHVRNIKEYNKKFIDRKLNPEKGHRYLPYIVVIIDEFGDLIMTAGKDIELPIARIAQKARAAGIHMIIATQRPTTNIITGTIKANFAARIAFRVSQMIDSRTILDRTGANRLIGRGDMLFLQENEPVRVQCAFVDTPEVEAITRFISSQQGYPTAYLLPEPDMKEDSTEFDDMNSGSLDPLFEEAARLIVIHQQGSTSLIQRKFSIGYNRAGRIMDQLEKAGIVGAAQGSKAREVLCADEHDLEFRFNNLLK